jgi:hypothetical protein
MKLIQLDNAARELYDLGDDPLELANVVGERPSDTAALNFRLNQLTSQVEQQRDSLTAGMSIAAEVDEHLLQRLRGLGYIE